MMRDNDIDIIGGGPSGLAVSYYAKKRGLKTKIYEKTDSIGGNCRTIIDGEFRYDTGAHRLHDKNDRVTSEIKSLLGKALIKVTAESKIVYKGNMIEFPLRVPNIFINMSSFIILKIVFENILNRVIPQGNPSSFKELAYQKYGETLSNLFLISYTEKLWGASADSLHPTIAGGRLSKLNLRSLILSLFSNKKYKPKHLEGDFYYPHLGFGEIFNALGKYIGHDDIYLNRPVNRINHDGKIIKSIENSKNEKIEVSKLVSTMPLVQLVRTMCPLPPDNIIKYIDALQYRSIMICVVYINIKSFTPNASLYFPDKDCPFTRIYEPKNRSAQMAPNDKTCIVIEIPIGKKNVKSGTSKQKIYHMLLEYLVGNRMLVKENIHDYKMIELKYAYPIINKDTEIYTKKILSYFNEFDNLHIIGRSASFEYLHTHDLMERAEVLVKKLA